MKRSLTAGAVALMVSAGLLGASAVSGAAASVPSRESDSASIKYFAGGGADARDAVVRVRGPLVLGWTALRGSDQISCFRGRMVQGKLVGKQFAQSPETGERFVGPIAVTGRGSGSSFAVTGYRYFDAESQTTRWDRNVRPVDRTTFTRLSGFDEGFDWRIVLDRCAALWRDL
jgi:hypothetical protein